MSAPDFAQHFDPNFPRGKLGGNYMFPVKIHQISGPGRVHDISPRVNGNMRSSIAGNKFTYRLCYLALLLCNDLRSRRYRARFR